MSGLPALAAITGPAEGVPISPLLILALGSIALGAVLSAGEEAARTITRAAAHEAEGRGADAVVAIAEDPEPAARVTGYLLVLAQMTGAVGLTLVLVGLLETWWQVLVGSILVAALIMMLVVGASPRRYGRREPVKVLATVGPPILALARFMAPIARLLSRMGERAGRTTGEQRAVDEEELRQMVDRVSESEQIDDDEREMLQGVFELGNTIVREVMVPRTDMVTLAAHTSINKARNLFVRSGFSRVPVVGDSVDDLRGVLYLKDVLAYTLNRPDRDKERVEAVLRTPVLVPETKAVDDLLEQMRTTGIHIAIAFDEWGGVAGLVTIEDVLEELVGELTDEHDRSEPEVKPDGEGSFLVPARLALDELGDLFDLEIEDDDVDTVAGLLAKALGKVPIQGAHAVTHGLELEAVSAAGRRRRIDTIRVTRAPEPEEQEDADERRDSRR
ncbi:hemolysin family protein [Pseudactinotalea terrae]|uniref:hemolysin family protein n=1 Tax=Pseudactinotalea terrae TaxID=1743262 RepID=UPI0012E0EBC0|nr:hemolysin family protein [Pseudactinotalea terrae]